jgi:hypothetical protein
MRLAIPCMASVERPNVVLLVIIVFFYHIIGAQSCHSSAETEAAEESDNDNEVDEQQLQQQRERERQQFGGQRGQQDPCASGEHHCKQPNMVCRAVEPSYRCECERGYEVQHDSSAQPLGWRCVGMY